MKASKQDVVIVLPSQRSNIACMSVPARVDFRPLDPARVTASAQLQCWVDSTGGNTRHVTPATTTTMRIPTVSLLFHCFTSHIKAFMNKDGC